MFAKVFAGKDKCKLYAHERQAEQTSRLLPKNCHRTETEQPKHRTPVDTKATNECTMHVINACSPTQPMHVQCMGFMHVLQQQEHTAMQRLVDSLYLLTSQYKWEPLTRSTQLHL
jgi:hypothetical protein